MKVKYAIIADAAFKSDTGKMNVIGIFSQIFVSAFPVVFGRLTLALGFEGENDDAPGRNVVNIFLVDPEGRTIMTCEVGMEMPVAVRPLIEIVSEWPPLVLEHPGDYVIRIEAPGSHPHELPLEVHAAAQQ